MATHTRRRLAWLAGLLAVIAGLCAWLILGGSSPQVELVLDINTAGRFLCWDGEDALLYHSGDELLNLNLASGQACIVGRWSEEEFNDARPVGDSHLLVVLGHPGREAKEVARRSGQVMCTSKLPSDISGNTQAWARNTPVLWFVSEPQSQTLNAWEWTATGCTQLSLRLPPELNGVAYVNATASGGAQLYCDGDDMVAVFGIERASGSEARAITLKGMWHIELPVENCATIDIRGDLCAPYSGRDKPLAVQSVPLTSYVGGMQKVQVGELPGQSGAPIKWRNLTPRLDRFLLPKYWYILGFTPGGEYLALGQTEAGSGFPAAIWVWHPKTGLSRIAAAKRGWLEGLWSPDGSKLAVMQAYSSRLRVFQMPKVD